ncbi:MAG: substrate-binding domain-containing protein [Spirochaetia bacterium]
MSGAKKWFVAMAGCALVIMMLAGCAQQGTSAKAAAGAGAAGSGTLQSMIDPNKEYVVVNCINTIEYWNAHKYAWKKAGQLFNVKTSWVGADNDDTSQMVSNLESVIAKKPGGIVVLGWDEGLAPSINKAVDLGIPVVTFSGDVVTSNRDTWVGTNQHDLGYVGGKKYAESVGGKGKVAILTYPGKNLFDGRQKGFEDAFKEYPGIKVVAIGNTKTDPMVAIQAAKDILVRVPDLTGFVCTDATGAMGAVTAVDEAKMNGKVDIIGLDRDSNTLDMIKQGKIRGTIIQDDATMLYWAMFDLISANYYTRTALLSTDNKAAGAKLTPNRIETAINYVDKKNVDLYLAANKIYVQK